MGNIQDGLRKKKHSLKKGEKVVEKKFNDILNYFYSEYFGYKLTKEKRGKK